MSKPEPIPPIAAAFVVLFFGFWFYNSYLMCYRPRRWVEWFVGKPWKPFGIAMVIQDEERLKKMARRLGLIYGVFGMVFLVIFFSVR